MHTIADLEQLNHLKNDGALFILFGGEFCAVCNNLKPKLDAIVMQRLPEMTTVYIDCEKSPDICAQHSVFSLPAVKAYIQGKLIAEASKSFGIEPLINKIERSYQIWSEI